MISQRGDSPCNFCIMEAWQRMAKKKDAALIVKDAPLLGLENSQNAKEVYIHYKGHEEATWCGWLMSVPEKCCC